MKRLIKVAVTSAIAAAWFAPAHAPLEACVGKTIYVGRLPGKEQELLAEIFSWMVSERTGTTIQVRSFPDLRTTHAAMQTAEVDLYLEQQDVALREIVGLPVPAGPAELRDTLRREYEQRYNAVWLEPWGPSARPGQGAAGASLVAPVVRKDTLKKFPALSRLVNKLSGTLDPPTMARLLQESERRPARDVAKQFLKDKRLI